MAMKKTGLKVRDVDKNHWASGVNIDEPKYSRLVVRILEGKHLLASDIETGKSDPVCFVWLGFNSESPDIINARDDEDPDNRFIVSSVCPTTVDPIWNQNIIFPLDLTDITSLLDMKCAIFVRDEDKSDDGNITYDELGMLEFSLKDIIFKGKGLTSSIVLSSAWYDLKKSPNMRRVEGSMKLTISVVVYEGDNVAIQSQLDEKFSNIFENRQSPNIGQLIQQALKSNSTNEVDPNTQVRNSINGPRGSSSPQRLDRSSSNRPLTAGTLGVEKPIDSDSKRRSQSASRSRPGSTERGSKMLASTAPIRRPLSATKSVNISASNSSVIEDVEELLVIPSDKKQSNSKPRYDSVPEEGQEDETSVIFETPQDILEFTERKQSKEGGASAEVLLESGPMRGDESLDALLSIGANIIDGLGIKDRIVDAMQSAVDVAVDVASQTLSSKNVSSKALSALSSAKESLAYGATSTIVGAVVSASDAMSSGALDILPGLNVPLRVKTIAGENNVSDKVPSVSVDIASNGEQELSEEIKQVEGKIPIKEGQFVPNLPDATAEVDSEKPKSKSSRFKKRKDLVDEFAQGPSGGDQSANIDSEPEEAPKTMSDSRKEKVTEVEVAEKIEKKREKRDPNPESSPISKPAASLDEEERISLNNAAQGSATAVVRILKELREQREQFQQILASLAKATEKGFERMSDRIHKMEEETRRSLDKAKGSSDTLLLQPSNGGDEGLPDDVDIEQETARPKSKGAKTKQQVSNRKSESGKQEIEPEKKRKSSRDSRSFAEFRQQQRAREIYAATTSDNFQRAQRSAYASEVEPQLVYRGESGNIATTKLSRSPVRATAAGAEMEFFAMPDQAPPPSPKPSYTLVRDAQQQVRSSGDYAIQSQAFSYREQPTSSQFKPSANGVASPGKGTLNRDFNEVLEKGSIDDVARLLESSGAKPECLSVSTRNRVYDVISTLLLQKKSIDRCLIWTVALLRGQTPLFSELSAHTQRDLQSGVEACGKEVSKRGMLASLLNNQIKRQLSG